MLFLLAYPLREGIPTRGSCTTVAATALSATVLDERHWDVLEFPTISTAACRQLLQSHLVSPGSRVALAFRFTHRLGWHRLGYAEMTEELRVPCDHLEKLHFCVHQY